MRAAAARAVRGRIGGFTRLVGRVLLRRLTPAAARQLSISVLLAEISIERGY